MLKRLVKNIPGLNTVARYFWIKYKSLRFGSSPAYWEKRYKAGGTSGAGSYSHLAEFKAQVINDFIREQRIDCVIEFGCGDGHQATKFTDCEYIGLDVSPQAILICKSTFA